MSEDRSCDGDAFSVSVVIPLFNKSPYIRGTLLSVFDQSHAPLEIIVVDDGSTDGGVDRIGDLVERGVRIVRQANAGPGPARNRGMAEASGAWIAFLDADDWWAPDHLATLASLHHRFADVDVVATRFRALPAGRLPSPALPAEANDTQVLVDFFSLDPTAADFFTSSIAIRRSACAGIGAFGSYWPGEDCEYWIRLGLRHRFALSSRITASYTQETGGLMDSVARQRRLGFHLQPLFTVLDAALLDPRYATRHALIRRHRTRLMLRNVRQALYRAEPAAARAFLGEIGNEQGDKAGWLRLLARVPAPVLRLGIAGRALLKGRGSRRATALQ